MFDIFVAIASSTIRTLDKYQREVGCLRSVYHCVELLHDIHIYRIFGLVGRCVAPPVGYTFYKALRHIYLELFALERKHVGVILEHNNTLDLGVVSSLHIFGVAYSLACNVGIEIRILEQSGTEDIDQ